MNTGSTFTPVDLGHGKPYAAGLRPRLRLVAHDRIGEDVIRLTYVLPDLQTPPGREGGWFARLMLTAVTGGPL